MEILRIEPREEDTKGRVFRATLLSYVTADRLWSGSGGGGIRPAMLTYAGTESECRAFTANLRMGRKAKLPKESRYRGNGDYFELLKSAGYAFTMQRFPEGVVMTAYLPNLVTLDPGMVDPTHASFLLLPSREWIEAQKLDIEPAVRYIEDLGLVAEKDDATKPTLEKLRQLARIAPLFAAYLDRRTRAPFVQDLRFYVQILVAFMANQYANFSRTRDRYYHNQIFGENASGFIEYETDTVGLFPGLCFYAPQTAIETILAEEVNTFLSKVGHGTRS